MYPCFLFSYPLHCLGGYNRNFKSQHEIRHIWPVLLVWLVLWQSAWTYQHIKKQISIQKKIPHTIKDDKVQETEFQGVKKRKKDHVTKDSLLEICPESSQTKWPLGNYLKIKALLRIPLHTSHKGVSVLPQATGLLSWMGSLPQRELLFSFPLHLSDYMRQSKENRSMSHTNIYTRMFYSVVIDEINFSSMAKKVDSPP